MTLSQLEYKERQPQQSRPVVADSSNMQSAAYAFLLAWSLSLVFSPIFMTSFFRVIAVRDAQISLFSGMLIALVLSKLVMKHCWNHRRILLGMVWTALILFVLTIIFLFVASPYQLILCWFLLGIETAISFVLCDYCMVTCGYPRVAAYRFIGKTTILGGFCFLGVNILQPQLASIMIAGLFLVSLTITYHLLFRTACRENIFSKDSTLQLDYIVPTKTELSLQAMFYVFGYGMLFGILLDCVLRAHPLSPLVGLTSFIIAFSVIISGMLILFFDTKYMAIRFCGELVRWFLPSGILLLISFSNLMIEFPIIKLIVLAILLIILTSYFKTRTAYLIKIERPEHFASHSSFLMMRILIITSIVLGGFLSSMIAESNELEITGYLIVILIFVSISIFGVGKYAFSLQRDYLERLKLDVTQTQEDIIELQSDKQNPYQEACQNFADKYELTNRETEILFHLGKGRNAWYMQEKLQISEHTVKTHIYHIYQKSEIHSQQELMITLDKWCQYKNKKT